MWVGSRNKKPAKDMRKIRRKALIQIIEKVAVGLVLLNAAVYFALVQPLSKRLEVEQQRFAAKRHQVREEQRRVSRLEKFQAALPGTDDKIKVFLRNHVPPRRRGYSHAARLVEQLTQKAGLQLSAPVAYRLDSPRDEPLQRLRIEVSVAGPFPSLLNFAHALETASDFIVLHDFTFEPSEGGMVTLRVGADLYLMP